MYRWGSDESMSWDIPTICPVHSITVTVSIYALLQIQISFFNKMIFRFYSALP